MVQADITEYSTYAVVCRLRLSPAYTITVNGGTFSHPDYPDVTIAVPKKSVPKKTKLPLQLKVGYEIFYTTFIWQCGPVVRALAVGSGYPGFKTRSDHSLNFFPIGPGSTSWLHMLGFLIVVAVVVVVVVFCCVLLALKIPYGGDFTKVVHCDCEF